MARTKGPIAQKDLRVFPVEDYPYIVTRPHESDPRYARSHKEALGKLRTDLDALLGQFKRLGISDAQKAIKAALADVEKIGLGGGSVDVEVDPYTKVRYRATVTRREEL